MKHLLIETQTFQPVSTLLFEGKTSPRGNPLVEGILATAEIKTVTEDTIVDHYGKEK
jgi:hypothetical protein